MPRSTQTVVKSKDSSLYEKKNISKKNANINTKVKTTKTTKATKATKAGNGKNGTWKTRTQNKMRIFATALINNGEKTKTVPKDKDRLRRMQQLNKKIEEFSKKQHICAFGPSVRLVKTTVSSFSGKQIRMRPEALNLIISSTDDFINRLLDASKCYIPRGQMTLQPEHIYNALSRPEFRSCISMVNSRIDYIDKNGQGDNQNPLENEKQKQTSSKNKKSKSR